MRAPIAMFALLAVSFPASGQRLNEAVGAIRDGSLNFHFAAREGVCGDGERYIKLNQSYIGSLNSGMRNAPCLTGPVQVRLTKVDGTISRVEAWVGPLKQRDGRDLGAVSAVEAATYLLQLAKGGLSSSKVIMPAVLADSARVWPDLLTIARDTRRSGNMRQDAAFWLSRFAAAAIDGHPNDLANEGDHTGADDEKTHAVFVISQLPREEGLPLLLDVAKSNKSARVRSAALFWLGQTGDTRALDLFESLLRK
jgi:hypothetical protein